jgi:hypothetical protein
MRVIRSFDELMALDAQLIKYVLSACPWLTYDWNPYETGMVYIIDDTDRRSNWILTQPHYDQDGIHCRDRISLKMATWDLCKPPAYFDETVGYWNVVAVFCSADVTSFMNLKKHHGLFFYIQIRWEEVVFFC